ncbi:MAG: hypothetical protein H6Q07_1480 [Acidobacteria bacterium]|nr:hypothetical protein [Acidobacteriota bacterium]
MHKRITWIVILIALFVLLGGLTFAVEMYFDYLWFSELGKTVVFTTSLYAKSLLGSVTLFVSFLFLYFNFLFANRGPGRIEIGIPTPTGQITAYSVAPETVRRLSGVLAALVGLFLGMAEANHWEMVWRWLHRVDFNKVDPVFSRDVSFYFFTLPFMNEIVRLGLILGFAALIFALVLYYFKGSLSWRKLRDAEGKNRIGLHISLLAALIFVLLAVKTYLGRFELLFGQHDVFSGANYTDLHARLPMLTALMIAALVGALLWIYNAFSSKNRAAILAVVLYFGVLFIGNLYPAVVQKFIVSPNELNKESPQIVNNISATLQAYGHDNVEERDLSGDKALTPQDIVNNSATTQSIRLWDHEPLLDALKQIQEIRTYYDFITVDNDRYISSGLLKQFMLSARELNSVGLPERNWINERLSYTHGYGLALGPVNRMTSEGLPVLSVQNIPPVSDDAAFKITRPEIYYGELTRGYAVVKTGQKEFDYPSGEANVYTTYEGAGGVPVHSLFRKLLFAFYFKDANIVFSNLVTPESRFLYFRDVRQRMSRLAPFLMLDQDPYMVISQGRLFWIQDGYTVSSRYPYSRATEGIGNYIRNSVKMVLDAYNGTVDLYVSEPGDPLIQVYQKIFPGVFRPISEFPPDLRSHLRYPEDIFTIQTSIYTVYHMGKPQIFYNKEDLWQVPSIARGGSENPMPPYYAIMRLPQEKQEEFILMLPFTPDRKDNLSAWMVARSDGENYGKLVVYRFPKQKLVYGPRQIVARINQDAEISRQVSLWDQRGSQVIQGNLLIIPIEEALLYIRPLYLRAESGKIPELKRVIVAYENKIAMEESLEGSLDKIFRGELTVPAQSGTSMPKAAGAAEAAAPAGDTLIRQAREAYERAVQAQRQGDWAGYGDEIKRLGAILEDLNRARDIQPQKKQ